MGDTDGSLLLSMMFLLMAAVASAVGWVAWRIVVMLVDALSAWRSRRR